ncbi:hypothetical protein [Paenibacillus chungangensis]|uniref:Uncharacterized protein n=1 Tax=Paenibacillus chungangensis TaxID=696535 RepID=A0ABW3HTR6_9BACL
MSKFNHLHHEEPRSNHSCQHKQLLAKRMEMIALILNWKREGGHQREKEDKDVSSPKT